MTNNPRPVLKSIAPETVRAFQALDHFVTSSGMRVTYYALALDEVPADFFADPDGTWSYDLLARAAGFASHSGVAIGALRESFNGHPEGAAVVTLNALTRPYVAIVECPIAYEYVQDAALAGSGSASSAA
jgi:hypothetical protein